MARRLVMKLAPLLLSTMVAIVNRRALIGSIISSTLCSSSVLVEDVAKFICSFTPAAFREAVQRTNHFLYRGQDLNAKQSVAAHICDPEPDLLRSGTYSDENALRYFECLEEQLTSRNVAAKPSTGHIGTSIVKDAQAWGQVVSVWPLGNELSYVYPRDERNFFPQSTCRESALTMDTGLELALRDGREVLFASWYTMGSSSTSTPSSFIAVPQKYDEKLKKLLQSLKYGLDWVSPCMHKSTLASTVAAVASVVGFRSSYIQHHLVRHRCAWKVVVPLFDERSVRVRVFCKWGVSSRYLLARNYYFFGR